MFSGLFSQYESAILVGAVLVFALSRIVSSSKKLRRKEKPDPAAIFGPIRGMYVCYQCDTIFNTTHCPVCHEAAAVPLIHLTGSILEDERVIAVTSRLKARGNWKLPSLQSEPAVQLAPATKPPNGDASEVPVTFVFPQERSRELS